MGILSRAFSEYVIRARPARLVRGNGSLILLRALRAVVASLLATVPLASPTLQACALVAFLPAIDRFGSLAILPIPAGFHALTPRYWSLFQFLPKPELAAAASLPLLVLSVLLLRA